MHRLLVTLCLLLSFWAPVWAQSPMVTKTLAWDFDGTAGTHFVLERKEGQQGTYTEAIGVIPITARTVQDTVPMGQIICWRIYTALPPYRSDYSKEVCHADVRAPINFRVH